MSGISAVMPDGKGVIGRVTALIASAAALLRAWHEIDPAGDITMEFIAAIPTWAVFTIAVIAVFGAFAFAFVRYTAAYMTVKKHAVAAGTEVPKFGRDYKIAMALDTVLGGFFAVGVGVVLDIVIINLLLSNFDGMPMAIPLTTGFMLAFIVGAVMAFILDALIIHDYFNGRADEKITAAQEEVKKAAEEALASEEAQKAAYAIIEEKAKQYGITEASVITKIKAIMDEENMSFGNAYAFLKNNGMI